MIHLNELKSNARSLFDSFKKVMDHDAAMTMAINSVCNSFTADQLIHPGKTFVSMEEVKNYIRHRLEEEVNVVVDDEEHYSLRDNEGHIPWYRSKKADDQIKFRFWNRYKKYLIHIKGWAETSVDKIDLISDEIMDDIEDPTIPNRPFDRRGLVVGYVQSGKTANFMGIINKAIDSGYRIIIVLAGMHENLRQQTQERIDEEVLGIDTNPSEKQKRIGVSTLPGEMYYPIDYFTESNLNPKKNGDFNKRKRWGTPPSIDRPILFVVKKNKSVLNNIRDYFQNWIDIFDEDFTYKKDGISQFNNLPLLIVDDEADQASVNTKASSNREGDELDPAAINSGIRQILNLFRQKIYIGYTATPFANIFIHHDNKHSVFGRDLFPFSFIKSIGTSSNFLGPKEFFGLGDDDQAGFPLYREVSDAGQSMSAADSENIGFMPVGHQSDYVPTEISATLKKALKAFVVSSAIRWYRGQENKHNTMLIHCTRFTNVQRALANLIDGRDDGGDGELTNLRNAILSDDMYVINELKDIFESDYRPTSLQMNNYIPIWDEILPLLKKAIRKIEPKCLVINGDVGDILDFKSKSNTGLWAISIGGDKLSRGLTLEGLTVSYFTRNTTIYDTLMQMGRWFGYRSGFEDLCRVYTTSELFNWYRHISIAFEALRSEFIQMARTPGLTPINFGLRVQDHPDLMVTNALKMRHAVEMSLNYQGTLTETTTLPADVHVLKSNYLATEKFVRSLGATSTADLSGRHHVWLKIPVIQIQEFFENFQTHKGLPTANTGRINQYISLQINNGVKEFFNWNVALVTVENKTGAMIHQFAGINISLPERSITEKRTTNGELDRYFVQRMHNPEYEYADYSIKEREHVKIENINNKAARAEAPRKYSPLLMIYVLSLKYGKEILTFDYQPVGFAISWSATQEARPINYVINTVCQELELSQND